MVNSRFEKGSVKHALVPILAIVSAAALASLGAHQAALRALRRQDRLLLWISRAHRRRLLRVTSLSM